MSDLLQIRINGQHSFFVSERIMSKYSNKLREIIKQEKGKSRFVEVDDFPCGSRGFELVSRFCYSNGSGIPITFSNVSILHCCAVFLEMNERASTVNLLPRTEDFLKGIFYWSWDEILICLKSCEPFFHFAETCGLVEKLMCSLLTRISQNSDLNLLSVSSSSSSSPETAHGGRNDSLSRKTRAWWFRDLMIMGPNIIKRFLKAIGCYLSENKNLILTRFLLHYLKASLFFNSNKNVRKEYRNLSDTVAYGVILMGKGAFSCRGLFSVLRITSVFGLSKEHQIALERLIGSMLDQVTVDDLLVSGGDGGEVYNVNFVLRLVRFFVLYDDEVSLHKMKRVGELVDLYLVEISPDPCLKISMFLGVVKSLPDCARDTFDRVYRAIDIYLEFHRALSLEEKLSLCRCLNYKKLSLEIFKDLAMNPRMHPRILIQSLSFQRPTAQEFVAYCGCLSPSNDGYESFMLWKREGKSVSDAEERFREGEEMKVELERMQWKAVEMEKMCREVKRKMARMVKLRV